MTTPTPGLPKDLPDAGRIESTKPITPGERQLGAPPTTAFENYMKPSEGITQSGVRPTQVSPFDLAHGQNLPTTPTIGTLTTQATQAQSTLGDVVTNLNTPNLKLKQSSKYLLKNKLQDASAHLRAANNKMGAETPQPPNIEHGASPLVKLIGYATDGQNNLEAAKRHLQELQSKGESLNPGDLLQIQIKLNQAQLEIQYSSVLLATAVEDMKTIFNITL